MAKNNKNDILPIIYDKVKSNQEILKLLYYDNSVNPLEQKNLTLTQAKEVCEKYLFTRKKIPTENEYIRCYLTMRYGEKKYHHDRNSYINGNTFKFWIISQDDYDVNKWIGSRACEIERCLAEMFDCNEIDVIKDDGATIPIFTEISYSTDMDYSDKYSGVFVVVSFNDGNGDMYG